jgi:hypothetical protein
MTKKKAKQVACELQVRLHRIGVPEETIMSEHLTPVYKGEKVLLVIENPVGKICAWTFDKYTPAQTVRKFILAHCGHTE